MKKIITSLMVLLISLVLTACGGASSGGNTPSDKNTTKGGSTTLTLSSDASIDKSFLVNSLVTLDGSASKGKVSSYKWKIDNQPAGASISLSDENIAKPTFTPTVVGSYTFTLTVKNAKGVTSSDSVIITITSTPIPLKGNAGNNQTVEIGTTVTLNASASTGTNITYAWTTPTGITLSDKTSSRPTFTASTKGSYVFNLVVRNSSGATSSDSVKVTVNDVAVSANAGNDRNVSANTIVTIEGNTSRGSSLLYSWRVISYPANHLPRLATPSPSSQSFYAYSGHYVFELTVRQLNTTNSSKTRLSLDAIRVPVANITANTEVFINEAITLDGTNSIGRGMSYKWDMVVTPGGNRASIVNATSSIASLTPNVTGPYAVKLTVTDVLNVKKHTTRNIKAVAAIAKAGDDINIHLGDTVTFNSTGSRTSTANKSIRWSTTSTPSSTTRGAIDALMSSRFSYTNSLTPTVIGSYGFTLAVTDDTYASSDLDAVSIVVVPNPVANAGVNKTGLDNVSTTLDGSNSTGTSLTYAWSCSSSDVTLTNETTDTPTFISTGVGQYTVTLTVTDHSSAPIKTSTDTMIIDVQSNS